MGILDFLRGSRKSDPDQMVLTQLKQAGSDLVKPHAIEFFLYFPNQTAADAAAARIKEAGFQVNARQCAKTDDWLCLATVTMIPEILALQKIRRDFASLAQSMNGEYDGWGTPIVR
jgi:regulator of RNase E activity RraB